MVIIDKDVTNLVKFFDCLFLFKEEHRKLVV